MKTLWAKLCAFVAAIYNRLGDPRSKNVLLFVLLAMTAFGMTAPETATSLRDTILALALK